MASYNELNALIDAYINRNGVQAITGQILNGVLKAMVEQLGRGYTIMGAATPTTDPGTPDGPECYFASETGTYTDFDGLQIVPGELALLCYTPSDGWTKETIYEGFQAVQATIDGNVGTPSVGVSYANGVLSFDFHNMKGNPGQNGQDGAAAGFGSIGADITGGVGTPGVTVDSSGPATAKNLQFHFTNLKGETGVTSVVATVDNTTGTPACTVSLVGQQLTLAFTGLKGAQGDTGSSVDYPFTIVNNLTTDDATQALSAAQGVVLDGKVTQLEAEIDGIPPISIGDLPTLPGHMGADGTVNTTSGFVHILLPISQYRGGSISVVFDNPSWGGQWAFIASVSGTSYTFVDGGSRLSGYPTNAVIPQDASYLYQLVSSNDAVVYPGQIEINAPGGSIKENLSQKEDSANKVVSWGAVLSDVKYPSEKLVKESLDEKLEETDVLEYKTKNLINPANIAFDRRYSNAELKIKAESILLIASSGLIPVVEGEWYVVSGLGIHDILGTNQNGGYFGENATGEIGDIAIANITWENPVDANGKCFQVPTGQGIKYVIISLATNDAHTALAGNAQMEEGEMATTYEDYNPVPKIKESLLPDSSTPVSTADELTKYTTFGNLTYPGIGAKIPTFRQHFYAKDKDLVVVNTGTSLTARSSEHCTLLADAPFRPPLMHTNNFASHIWDKLCWQGQQYRRYDSGYFTETGTGWQTQSNIADWDDGAYRAGLTRYTDNGGGIAFAIPIGAWQFNFIYRSDSEGSTACVIAIAEGDNKVEVWNGSAWVEANGYSFSEKEGAVESLTSVTYTNPNTGASVTLSNYQVKGNTTYQKRLKMRCKSGNINSLSSAKSVTITSASGRLLYWGVEWSPREFMITYINAARGSHNSMVDSASSLLHFQDNEVWGFKPDLLLSEDPIHNSGGGGVPSSSYIPAYFGNVTEQFWFASNGVSMKARCATLGLTEPEWALFNTTITWNFGGITDDGVLKVGPIANGLMWSALESQSSVYMAMLTNHPEIIYINAVKNWVDACMACYQSMKAATVGSGKDGTTFTNEGSHWNDTGCKIMARVILPILDFVI